MSIYMPNSWRPEKGVRIPGASIKAAVSYMTQTLVLWINKSSTNQYAPFLYPLNNHFECNNS